jgi:hypothetical protein
VSYTVLGKGFLPWDTWFLLLCFHHVVTSNEYFCIVQKRVMDKERENNLDNEQSKVKGKR